MPSSYTSNLGIEKPGDGEQSGTWGDTVNDNMDILDRAINGVLNLTLSGSASDLLTGDGSLSDGQYKLVLLSGAPSATHTVTIKPNDAEKIYFVTNNTASTVVFTQGSGGNVTVLAGDGAVIYADGGGTGAAVSTFSDTFFQNAVQITGGTITGITDLAVADGGTGSSTAAGALVNLGLTATAAELNTMDGITATTAELNILDGVTATTAELNILDGATLSTAELNYVDGVTSALQTQLDAKQPLDATLTALAGLSTGANKIPMASGTDTFTQIDFKDEDNMASNSATAVPSQQSTKAYVDATVGAWEVAQTVMSGSSASTSLTTNDFADGYDYRLEFTDVSATSVGTWYLSITGTNGNTSPTNIITVAAGTASVTDDLWAYADFPLARYSSLIHTVKTGGNEDPNWSSATNGVLAISEATFLVALGGATKIKSVTIHTAGGGTFDDGVITLLRRKIYNV